MATLQNSASRLKFGGLGSLVHGLSNFRRITHHFRDTGCFVAEKHIFAYLFVFDLEFEDHAIGMWRRNLAPENWNHGASRYHMVKK